MSSTEQKPGLMRRIGAGISTVFTIIFRLFFVLSLVLGAVVAWMVLSGGPAPKVENNVGLVVAPSGILVEQVDIDPLQDALRQISGEPALQTAVRDVVTALERARDDDRIPFAVLKVDGITGAGLGVIDTVARAVRDFRESGKPVYVWSDILTQTQYLLAAQADDISLDPFGGIWLEGLSVYPNYFAGLLEKLGVEVNVFRVGDYKSAVEPFIRRDMSEEARENTAYWLSSVWDSFLQRAAVVREDAGSAIATYLDTLPDALEAVGGNIAQLQLDSGLVDRLETITQFRERLGETVGMDTDNHGSFRQINYRTYLRATRDRKRKEDPRPVVAQVTLQGVIVDGMGSTGQAGGDRIAAELDRVRLDDDVQAVVLRVDSPGGSALASERIRQAVRALQASGKPVVASMGSVAASGGYWVSMSADRILAHDGTITGSIGVFGLWFSGAEGLSRLGIDTDGVGTSPLAGAARLDRSLDPGMGRVFQAGVEYVYDYFVNAVAEGRALPVEAVQAMAGGRVFSGRQALERGLIDALGDLQNAADQAAALAGLEPGTYQLRAAKAPLTGVAALLQQLSGQVGALLDGRALAGWMSRWAVQWLATGDTAVLSGAWWSDPQGRYALCECLLHGDGTPRAMARAGVQDIQ